MRLSAISVQDAMPVRRFEVADLADTVVIAGPNGVGKTRLIDAVVNALRSPGAGGPVVQAEVISTNQAEQDAWGKAELDLTNPEDARRLTQMLQVGRKRRSGRAVS
jgi:predicted ATP-binding protein involved in virulence